MSKKLEKSLQELDTAADELLKSSKAQELKEEKEDDDVKADEISENIPKQEDEDEDEKTAGTKEAKGEDDDEDGEAEKEDGETVEKSKVKKSCGSKSLKKGEDETDVEEDDEVETSDEEEEDDSEQSDEDIHKNIKKSLDSEEAIKQGVEASEFLTALTSIISKSLGDMGIDIRDSSVAQTESTQILAKSLQAVISASHQQNEIMAEIRKENTMLRKSLRTMGETLEGINESLEEVLSQPVTRKSVGRIGVIDRNFKKSIETGATEEVTLSKSQVLGILSNEFASGNNMVTESDIISYESGAPLRPEVEALVNSKAQK